MGNNNLWVHVIKTTHGSVTLNHNAARLYRVVYSKYSSSSLDMGNNLFLESTLGFSVALLFSLGFFCGF